MQLQSFINIHYWSPGMSLGYCVSLNTMFAQDRDEGFLPVEGREKTARREHEGSLRQERPPVVHPVQIPSSHVSHADRSG